MVVKSIYFVAASLLLIANGIYLADANQKSALSRREVILAVDKAGKDTSKELAELSAFAHSHMNVSVQLTLEGAYSRASDAAIAGSIPGADSRVYAEAQGACNAHKDSIAQATCFREYINARLPAGSTNPLKLPDKNQYTYSFKSPFWTPDAAGISLAGGVLLMILALIRPKTKRKGRR